MIMNKARLFILLSGLCCWSGYARGEIVSDCTIVNLARLEGSMNPQLVLAVAKIESSKNGKARNGIHYGLMQLKLDTARMLGFRGKPNELLNWKLNLRYGSKYLNEKLRRYRSKSAALAAYNAGAAFPCKKTHTGCLVGSFINQNYVDIVMRQYRKNPSSQCV